MARIKLEFHNNSIFVTTVKVRISDINYGNHVGNDAFVSLIHEARMQWLGACGFNELEIEGSGLIMSDLAIEFKQECFYGEEVQISLSSGDITKVSFDLYYTIQTTRHESTFLIAKAKTGMVSYDYNAKKVTPIPQVLLTMLNTSL